MTRTENIDETELVQLVRAGNPAAMKELYVRYAGYMTAVASRYIADRDSVRDVLQESFVKIFSAVANFEYRGAGSLRAWMTRITVNEALKHLKRRERFDLQLSDRDMSDRDMSDVADDGDDPPPTEVPQSVIQEMVRELPTGYRTVFNLYVFEGRSHREIADLLGIAESSSASQLHRARNILAKRIREYERTNRRYERQMAE